MELLQQGGMIKDLAGADDLNMPDMSEYVALFYGDLGTGKQIQAAQI